jgi:GntR family transcriptional regulator, histidine utilization repressor
MCDQIIIMYIHKGQSQNCQLDENCVFCYSDIKMAHQCFEQSAKRQKKGKDIVAKSGNTSFQTIKNDIMEKIKSRYWSPGDTIPGEEALAVQYGCSRMTVNRALRELADSGIVERRRKSGTRVALQPDRAANLKIPVVRKEIEAKGAAYRYAMLERIEVEAPENIRANLSLQKGDKVLHIRCLHFSDETPYQYENRWINLSRVPLARDETFESISPNEWLIDKEPFSEAEHAFSAQLADDNTATLLGIQKGDPLFVTERRTWQGTETITAVKLSNPGATFKMISRG